MNPGAVAAGVLLGAALLLAWPGRPALRPDRGGAGSAAEPSPFIQRHRLSLSVVCGAAAALFFGGALGVAAGALAGGYAWRALGRAGTAAARARDAALRDDLPGAVDLLVGALRAGTAAGPALALVADALPGPVGDELRPVVRRLDLGADPGAVWRDVSEHPQLGPLGRALGRAHARGAAVVPAAERLAAELRERGAADVEARARAVSTRAAAPLGACFLPAFVLLGIVPLVAGLVGSLGLLG